MRLENFQTHHDRIIKGQCNAYENDTIIYSFNYIFDWSFVVANILYKYVLEYSARYPWIRDKEYYVVAQLEYNPLTSIWIHAFRWFGTL